VEAIKEDSTKWWEARAKELGRLPDQLLGVVYFLCEPSHIVQNELYTEAHTKYSNTKRSEPVFPFQVGSTRQILLIAARILCEVLCVLSSLEKGSLSGRV
jgi:hypothetical protein